MNKSLNLSLSATNTVEECDDTDIPVIWKYIIYSVILVIASFGNILLIVSLYRVQRKRFTITNLLITNLAFSELLVVISSIVAFIIEESLGYFPFGDPGCRIIFPLSTFGLNSVTLSLVCLALERYIAICHPFRYQTLKRFAYQVVILCHVTSFLSALPYVIAITEEERTCIETWSIKAGGIYTIFLFLVQYMIPLPLIIALYSYTWYSIKKINDDVIQSCETHRPRTQTNDIDTLENARLELIKKINKEKSGTRVRHLAKRMRRNKKQYITQLAIIRHKQTMEMLKLFIMIIMVFAIFMLPNQIVWLYSTVIPDACFSGTYLTICDWLTYANAILNPVIYGCNHKYRKLYLKNIRHMLQLCCIEISKRKKNTLNSMNSITRRLRTDSTVSSEYSSLFIGAGLARKRKDSFFSSIDATDDSYCTTPNLFQQQHRDSVTSVEVVLKDNNDDKETKSEPKRYRVKTCVNDTRPISIHGNPEILDDDKEYLDLFFPDDKHDIKSHRLYKSALTNSIKQKYLPVSNFNSCIETIHESCNEHEKHDAENEECCQNNIDNNATINRKEKRKSSKTVFMFDSEEHKNQEEDNNIDSTDCQIKLNNDIYIDKKNRLSFFRDNFNILDLDSDFSADSIISSGSILDRIELDQDVNDDSIDSGTYNEPNTFNRMYTSDSLEIDEVDNLNIDNIELHEHTLKIECSDGKRKLSFIFNTKKHNIMEFLNEAARETDC